MTGTCKHCGQGLIPASRWRQMTTAAKEEARRNNMARKGGDGACHRCHRRTGDSVPRTSYLELTVEAATARLEDVAFMVECGESLSGAAARLGIGASGLEAWLKSHDATHLTAALRVNGPRDHNRSADGSRVTWIDANSARYGRRKASA